MGARESEICSCERTRHGLLLGECGWSERSGAKHGAARSGRPNLPETRKGAASLLVHDSLTRDGFHILILLPWTVPDARFLVWGSGLLISRRLGPRNALLARSLPTPMDPAASNAALQTPDSSRPAAGPPPRTTALVAVRTGGCATCSQTRQTAQRDLDWRRRGRVDQELAGRPGRLWSVRPLSSLRRQTGTAVTDAKDDVGL